DRETDTAPVDVRDPGAAEEARGAATEVHLDAAPVALRELGRRHAGVQHEPQAVAAGVARARRDAGPVAEDEPDRPRDVTAPPAAALAPVVAFVPDVIGLR